MRKIKVWLQIIKIFIKSPREAVLLLKINRESKKAIKKAMKTPLPIAERESLDKIAEIHGVERGKLTDEELREKILKKMTVQRLEVCIKNVDITDKTKMV